MDAQQQAADQAMRLQQEQFARQQQNITPFMEAGGLGLNALLAEFGLGGGQGGGANVGGTQYDVASYVQQNPDVQAMGQQLQQQSPIQSQCRLRPLRQLLLRQWPEYRSRAPASRQSVEAVAEAAGSTTHSWCNSDASQS
jgi:hypothetical protein